MLNSASTIFTMDLYKRHLKKDASQSSLILLGRLTTLSCAIVGCVIAPFLAHPRLGGVFTFIQEFQGYISPGIVATFLFGFVVKRAPGAAGVVALLVSAPIYGLLHWQMPELHYLIRMMITFLSVIGVMTVITLIRPLDTPRVIPVKEDLDMRSSPTAKLAGAMVVVAVIVLFVVFR